MRIRCLIFIILLITSMAAHSAPIRLYFAGQIDSISTYEVIDATSIPFRIGEHISGWAEMNWDEAYPVSPTVENVYDGGFTYKIFIGDGSRSVWSYGASWSEIYAEEFGVGLPKTVFDNGPIDAGIWPDSWIDDAYIGFNNVGGRFTFDHIIHAIGGTYDVRGSFLFTDGPVPVNEPLSIFLLLFALTILVMARVKQFRLFRFENSFAN